VICKVLDDLGVTHYRIVGWRGNWLACDSDANRGRPASRRRPVDCMACAAIAALMPTCPHTAGDVVSVVSHRQDYWFLVRYCARCVDATRAALA
jgi:hypothetical protein